MPSKAASVAMAGCATYGASLAFTSVAGPSAQVSAPSRPAASMHLRGSSSESSSASWARASSMALGGAVMAAGAAKAAKRTNKRSVQARSTAGGVMMGLTEKLKVPGRLIDNVDIFIFDCDGVIWRGDSLIPGIPKVLDELRAQGKKLFFVTNNSTKSRAGYKSKFTSLGLDVEPEEIFSSSFAAAAYLEQTNFKATGKKVYIIGEKGIGEELDLIGVPWFGAEADKGIEPNMGPGGRVEHDKDVGAVIVGFDRNINYYKLQYAQLCLNENPGCQFIATNLDRVTHLTDAQEWSGNGTMVGAVKGCTGMEPELVGKPAPLMIDYIAQKYNISDRSRICMVGDRLDTDIAFGRNNGLKTCLTLSGVTSEDELMYRKPRKAGTEEIEPEFYVDTINDFIGGSAAPAAPAAPAAAAAPAAPAQAGGEFDVSDSDILAFYNELTTGGGGDCPKGSVVSELIVKFFHGEFTPQGFKRYSGLWKGPPPGTIGKKDIAVAMAGLKEQMKAPMFVSKGGVGYGIDESQKVEDDGKGWVWLAAEMSPGGLAVELFKSVPYGKRALLVAKQSNVDELFSKINWDVALANVEKTLGGPQIKQR